LHVDAVLESIDAYDENVTRHASAAATVDVTATISMVRRTAAR
jgi:hypothetical protein